MVAMTLLDRARAVGLRVFMEGDRLVVEGLPHYESLARELLDHKPAIVAALRSIQCLCPYCGSVEAHDFVLTRSPHDGTSTRRDCARCGRFLRFARWYGRSTN